MHSTKITRNSNVQEMNESNIKYNGTILNTMKKKLWKNQESSKIDKQYNTWQQQWQGNQISSHFNSKNKKIIFIEICI